jgi:hypothetical protein
VEDLLPDRHPDTLLELKAHQRHRAIEHVRGLVHLAGAEQADDLHEHLWKRESGHRAGRAGKELLEQEHAPESTKDAQIDAGRPVLRERIQDP